MRIWNHKYECPPADAIYVGRGTPFGNPFRVGFHGDRNYCCDRFEEWFLKQEKLVAYAKDLLRGRDLVCSCAPSRCHAETLMRIANE